MRDIKRGGGRRGAALAVVLVFMTLMLALGTGLLAAAQYGTSHSIAVQHAGRHYYAAESAAQFAAQLFLTELGLNADANALMIENLSIEQSVVDLGEYVNGMKQELYNRVQGRYLAQIKSRVESREFNGEAVTLGELRIIDRDTQTSEPFGIGHITSEVVTGDDLVSGEGTPILAAAVVYVANPNFVITASSGGRTITVETNADEAQVSISTENTTVSGDGSGGNVSSLHGVFYRRETQGIYGGGDPDYKNDRYNHYMSNLSQWLEGADSAWGSVSGPLGESIVIPPSDAPGFPAASAYNEPAARTARYINTWNVVVLGTEGTTTRYENLEYIKSASGIVIRGKVELPNLKGVYIPSGQAEIGGEVSFPLLEHFYVASGNITIHSGTKINPMTVGAAGQVTGQNRPLGRGNFYGGSVLSVSCTAEINWCKFNVLQIDIRFGAGGRFITNSIYLSRDWVRVSGRAGDDIGRTVPQFYMRGYIEVSGNVQNLSGIFITPDTRFVVNNGNGFDGTVDMVGLFVGNFNRTFPPGPISNPPPRPFSAETFDLIKNNEYIDLHISGSGDTDSPATAISGINYTYNYRGLKLRETTGE